MMTLVNYVCCPGFSKLILFKTVFCLRMQHLSREARVVTDASKLWLGRLEGFFLILPSALLNGCSHPSEIPYIDFYSWASSVLLCASCSACLPFYLFWYMTDREICELVSLKGAQTAVVHCLLWHRTEKSNRLALRVQQAVFLQLKTRKDPIFTEHYYFKMLQQHKVDMSIVFFPAWVSALVTALNFYHIQPLK